VSTRFFILTLAMICERGFEARAADLSIPGGADSSALLCKIEVVEKVSQWPVPLVELRTTHGVRFVSDNAGLIAFDLPELMGRETWFDVIGQGYEVPKDGFGYRGVRLIPQPGARLRVEVERTIIARRIGRLTGGGLFSESQKLGLERAWQESGVLGCDSVQNAVHNGQLFWVWGDTTMARYPLGIFNGTGATTSVRALSSFEPPLRLNFDYFRDAHGQPRGVVKAPGEGPTWLTGFISLPDRNGQSHLVASYMKIKPPLEAYQWGLATWTGTNFETLRIVWTKSEASPKPPPVPEGHPVIWTNADGQQWVMFGNPFPTLKCPASFEAWQSSNHWQTLISQKSVPAAEEPDPIEPHSGSIAWNGFRKRWVTVFMQRFGTPSAFGELWYAEADSPIGPWGPAVKILSHDHYTFYNPRLHPELTPESSPQLFFEGTYTMQFSDNHQPTPRYDYNQMLYRLDLDAPSLAAARGK
jgi:hypothetical protein